MDTKFTRWALEAYIRESRGMFHDSHSLGAATAEQVADSFMRRVDGKPCGFRTGTVYGVGPAPADMPEGRIRQALARGCAKPADPWADVTDRRG